MFTLILFLRTTPPEEPAEGTWQVSVVSAQADEVAAEHRSNTKVSLLSWIWVCTLPHTKFSFLWNICGGNI